MKKTVYLLLEIDYDSADAEREGVTESQIATAVVESLEEMGDADFRGRVLAPSEVARLR